MFYDNKFSDFNFKFVLTGLIPSHLKETQAESLNLDGLQKAKNDVALYERT